MIHKYDIKMIFYGNRSLLSLSIMLMAACLLFVGCQPNPASEQNLPPTAIPFPTVTPGREIKGLLPEGVGVPLNGVGLSNPATAVALANQPTATPDYKTCPGSGNATTPERPTNGRNLLTSVMS
jgi:hypothetical protein